MTQTFNNKEMCYIAGIIIIFVILILIYFSRSMEDCMLKGFWRANDGFCHDAELELFVMYIGDDNSYVGHNRPSFILAANSDGVILNNPVDINFGSSMNIIPGMASCKKYNAEIDWHDDAPEEDVFPTNVQIAFYPRYGKLVFYKDDSVLAILWKDQEMSTLDTDLKLIPGEILGEDADETDNGADETSNDTNTSGRRGKGAESISEEDENAENE